jgi:hemerythrin-like domain-containing protein
MRRSPRCAAVSQCRSDPTPAKSSALTDRIGELLVLLEGHLDEEEQVVVPLIDPHLTEGEWQEVESAASRSLRRLNAGSPPDRWLRSRRPRRRR